MKFLYSRLNKRWLLLALTIGLLVCIAQFLLQGQIPVEDTPYTRWLGIDPFSFTSTIFFILLPLIASLPAGIMLKEDQDSGLLAKFKLNNTLQNVLSKYMFIAFISGFVVIALPLLVNLTLWLLRLPNIKPDNLLNGRALIININTFFVSLYYTHPFVHSVLAILFAGIWGGLFAVFVMVTSIWINNRFVALCSSLILQIAIFVLNSFIKLPNNISYSPADFLHNGPVTNVSLAVTGIVTLLMIVYCFVMLFLARKRLVQ
ncbi:hypothetical protein PT287_00070 [Lactobacillus sp. ESL0679]|uniref:hypothetical protein n=1 Tax=unclassified Lactobacillus TaxID=2620435 RepID=UPI0023F9A1C5|nr:MULTISPECIES: hypothetical protein [unclassified Lactobacillus]MDF7681916.1 hypothetical protein [Lactobacillus sp. ESL0679]WEV36485.1 hypothetical protein OZX76_07035 [Lactobacillus sp. ESL0677]